MAINLISYKILRYLTPVFLIVIFVLSFLLSGSYLSYAVFFMLQVLFYLFAWIGYGLKRSGSKIKIFALPFNICYLELGMLSGLIKFLQGKKVLEHTKES